MKLKTSQLGYMDHVDDIVERIRYMFPKLYIVVITNDDLEFEPEQDEGYIEYKRTLVGCNDNRVEKYATQMYWRITENTRNQATYYIGIDDDGAIMGLSNDEIIECIVKFTTITTKINASIMYVKIICIKNMLILEIKVKIKKTMNSFMIGFDVF